MKLEVIIKIRGRRIRWRRRGSNRVRWCKGFVGVLEGGIGGFLERSRFRRMVNRVGISFRVVGRVG